MGSTVAGRLRSGDAACIVMWRCVREVGVGVVQGMLLFGECGAVLSVCCVLLMQIAVARAARLSLMLRLLAAACLLLLLLAADAAAWLLLPLPLHAAEAAAAAAAIIELVLWAVGWQQNGSSPSFMQPKFSSKP